MRQLLLAIASLILAVTAFAEIPSPAAGSIAADDPLAPQVRTLSNGATVNVVKCYPNGLMRAYCVSFDDGKLASDQAVLESLRKRGIAATFFLNSLHPQSQEALAHPEAYAGFEVASHGAHHKGLINVPPAEQREEIVQDQTILGERFHNKVEGFAYPYGAIPKDLDAFEQLMKSLGIVYARGTTATGAFRPPENFLRWNPDCGFGSQKNLDRYLGLPAENSIRVLMEFAHSVDFTNGRMQWGPWEEYLDRLAKEPTIWKVSMLELARYVMALRAISLTDQGIQNNASLPVWVCVNGKAIEIPPAQIHRWND